MIKLHYYILILIYYLMFKVGTSLLMYTIFCSVSFTKYLFEQGTNINSTDKVIIYIIFYKK